MSIERPTATVLEPEAVAEWLDVSVAWVMRQVAEDGMPVLGYRGDGTPLFATEEVSAWLRRPRLADDET